jgi:hypothetical protein
MISVDHPGWTTSLGEYAHQRPILVAARVARAGLDPLRRDPVEVVDNLQVRERLKAGHGVGAVLRGVQPDDGGLRVPVVVEDRGPAASPHFSADQELSGNGAAYREADLGGGHVEQPGDLAFEQPQQPADGLGRVGLLAGDEADRCVGAPTRIPARAPDDLRIRTCSHVMPASQIVPNAGVAICLELLG